jgi:predicted nucleotidyltransferase
MSYKDNKYFKKYCNKHKDIKRTIRDLETFCAEENCDFYVFGSILREDFYYKQSDCDLIIACNDIDRTIARFEYYIQTNKNIHVLGLTEKRLYSVQNITQIKDPSAVALLLKININGLPLDINFLKKKDYTTPGCINIIQPTNYLFIMFISIIKILYYKINIIPYTLYINMKKFINNYVGYPRYKFIKEI